MKQSKKHQFDSAEVAKYYGRDALALADLLGKLAGVIYFDTKAEDFKDSLEAKFPSAKLQVEFSFKKVNQ